MATQVEIVLEDTLFSVDVVARTAQRFTDDFFVDVLRDPAGYLVRLTLRDAADLELLAERFKNEALDERLREQVRAETRDIHNALINAALKSATPLGER